MDDKYRLYAFRLGTQQFNLQGEFSKPTILIESIRETLEDGNVNYVLVKIDRNNTENHNEIPDLVEKAVSDL